MSASLFSSPSPIPGRPSGIVPFQAAPSAPAPPPRMISAPPAAAGESERPVRSTPVKVTKESIGHENRHGEISGGQSELSFGEFLDAINPLQHLPIVGSIYRELTGDTMSPASRTVGGILFGGPVGFAVAMVNNVVEAESGKDVGGNLVAWAGGGKDPAAAPPANMALATDPALQPGVLDAPAGPSGPMARVAPVAAPGQPVLSIPTKGSVMAEARPTIIPARQDDHHGPVTSAPLARKGEGGGPPTLELVPTLMLEGLRKYDALKRQPRKEEEEGKQPVTMS